MANEGTESEVVINKDTSECAFTYNIRKIHGQTPQYSPYKEEIRNKWCLVFSLFWVVMLCLLFVMTLWILIFPFESESATEIDSENGSGNESETESPIAILLFNLFFFSICSLTQLLVFGWYKVVIEDKGDYLQVDMGPLKYGRCLCNVQNERIVYSYIKHYRKPKGCIESLCCSPLSAYNECYFGGPNRDQVLRHIASCNGFSCSSDLIVIEYEHKYNQTICGRYSYTNIMLSVNDYDTFKQLLQSKCQNIAHGSEAFI